MHCLLELQARASHETNVKLFHSSTETHVPQINWNDFSAHSSPALHALLSLNYKHRSSRNCFWVCLSVLKAQVVVKNKVVDIKPRRDSQMCPMKFCTYLIIGNTLLFQAHVPSSVNVHGFTPLSPTYSRVLLDVQLCKLRTDSKVHSPEAARTRQPVVSSHRLANSGTFAGTRRCS